MGFVFWLCRWRLFLYVDNVSSGSFRQRFRGTCGRWVFCLLSGHSTTSSKIISLVFIFKWAKSSVKSRYFKQNPTSFDKHASDFRLLNNINPITYLPQYLFVLQCILGNGWHPALTAQRAGEPLVLLFLSSEENESLRLSDTRGQIGSDSRVLAAQQPGATFYWVVLRNCSTSCKNRKTTWLTEEERLYRRAQRESARSACCSGRYPRMHFTVSVM